MACKREATGYVAINTIDLDRRGVQYGGRLVWSANSHGKGFTLVILKITM